jgi:fructokinase
MSGLLGGVETGGTWCVCALGRSPEDLSDVQEFRTTDPRETVGQIAAFFSGARTPAALGIGAFGPLDLDPCSPTWGHVTTTPKPGWQNWDLLGALREALPQVPLALDTDVNAAALGERRWGAGRGCQSLCYLTVGTGIGGGLLHEGRPWHGLIHPEMGHLRVPHDRRADPFPGNCPVHGDCLEGLAGGRAIEARWGRAPQELPDDHPAWRLEAQYLALGLVSIVCVATPQRIILGGGVLERPGLLRSVRSRLRDLLGGYLASPLLLERLDDYVVEPELGDRAGVLGAIALAQDAL